MPRINRARVVNIRYDDDRKSYPDQVFDFRGENAIVLLENGGGKTLLMQLLLQVIRRNTPLNKRLFRDLFSPGQTSHLMIEWLSDGPEAEYVLTGLTAMLPRDSESLSVFNFIHSYTEPDPFDLDSIPVIRNRRVTPRSEFRSLLRSADRDIRIHDIKEEYERDLATYNIFPSEWEAIRRANDEEGRTEGFFDGATTVARLFRGILIPSVIDVLYPGDDRHEVAQVFAELRGKLVNIPRYQEELDELDRASDLIDEIRGEIVEFGRLSGLHEESLVDIRRLYFALEKAIPVKEGDVAALRDKLASAAGERRTAEFELECLDVDEGRIRLESLVHEREKAESDLGQLQQEMDQVQGRKNLLEAGELKARVLEKDQQRAEVRARLQVAEENIENLAAELGSLRRTQLQLLPAEIRRVQQAADKVQGQLDGRTAELEAARRARTRIRAEIAELQENRGALRDRIERADRRGREVEKRLGWEARMNPSRTLEEYQARHRSLEEERDQLEETIATAQGKIEEMKEQLGTIALERTRSDSQQERFRELLEAFERERADLQAALMPYVESQRRLDELHSAALMVLLEGERRDLGRRLEQATVRYHESRAGLSRMESEEVYVPNSDMVAVRDALADLGIEALFGGQLVGSQPLQEKEQLEVLDRHPLLPYGLVITRDELRTLSAGLEVLTELSLEAPVPLFTDRETLLLDGGPTTGLVSIGDGYTHLVPNSSFPLHVSEEKLLEHRRGLQSGAQNSRERMELARQGSDRLGEIMSRLRGFQERYRPEHGDHLDRELAELSDTLSRLEGEGRHIQSRIQEEAGIQREAARQRDEAAKRVTRIRGETAQIDAYLSEFREGEKSSDEIKAVDALLTDKEAELEDVEGRERALSESIRGLSEELEVHREELVRLGRLLEDLGDSDLGEGKPLPGTYAEITDRISAVQDQLDGAGTAGLRKLVEELTERIDEWTVRIRDLGFDPVQVVPRRVPRSSIDGLGARMKELRRTLASVGKRVHELVGDVREVEGEIRTKCRDIEGRYGRTPPAAITVRRVDQARARVRERIAAIDERTSEIDQELDAAKRLADEWLEVARRARTVLQRQDFDITYEDGTRGGPPEDPRLHLENLEDTERQLQRRVQAQRFRVTETYGEAARAGGHRHQVTRDVFASIRGLPREMLFDSEEMEPRFNEFFALLRQSREVLEENLRILEEDRREVERKALREGERLLDELGQIEGYSRFSLRGRRTYTVRIDLRAPGGEERAHRMSRYVERSVNRLVELEEAAVEGFVRDRFSPHSLVDAIAPVDGYRVRILKPQRQVERANYVPWESVPKWSGGEKFTAYFMMLVTLLSYLRARRVPEYASGKVLIADNPFGRASSPHLLEVVFGLARETGTQMICLTALKDRAIYENFPIVYSLVLRRTQGRQYVEVGEGSVLPTGSAVISSAQYGLFDERTDDDG